MSKITNTAKVENLVPGPLRAAGLPVGYLVGDGAIEAQEARGAAEMASQTEQLPAEGSKNPAWAKMGVIFGEAVKGDDLFRKVALPPGWQIKRTDHSMWTTLVDDKGRDRAGIFYKAAFYDRNAHITPTRRYSAGLDYSDGFKGRRAVVRDCGQIIFATETLDKSPVEIPRNDHNGFQAQLAKQDALKDQAVAWLDERFPDWRDDAAYWD